MKKLLLLGTGLVLSYLAFAQGCIVNYVAPSFQLSKTNLTCVANSGTITVINPQDGVGPYNYRLIETNTSNTTGFFSGLPAGLYTIEMRDACGTIRTRQATVLAYHLSFQFTINRLSDCNDGKISFVPSPAGNYEYAVVTPSGDTTWSSAPDFNIVLFKNLTIIVKDACGNVQVQSWTAPRRFLPYIQEIQHNLQCSKFDLFVVDYGFTDPEYCLYHSDGTLYGCQSTPNFFDVPYGDYYFIVSDKCFTDSMFQPNMVSAGGSQIDPYNWDCTTFTMHVDGMEDTVCLYNATTNQLISCKGQDTTSLNPRTGLPWPSGAVWENLPYGSYYAWIYDPCMDSTFRIDSTVTYPFKTIIACRPSCSLTETEVFVNFDPGTKSPYSVSVYYPDGTLARVWNTIYNDCYIPIPEFPGGGLFTVIASDACRFTDTGYVRQEMLRLYKTIDLVNKCPGISGISGSGDLTIEVHSSDGTLVATPTIIKKNGSNTTINYATKNNTTYYFPDLESGTYIVSYRMNYCSQISTFDTIVIRDYVYPVQPPILVYQCFINQFTFRDTVTGGLAPFTYQIISNLPAVPSLLTAPQASPVFTVTPGAAYQSMRVRAVDVCGNSTIGDVAVQQLPGCEVLQVDSLPGRNLVENKVARVYPNPSTGKFYISFSQKKKSNYKIEIANAAGVKLFQLALNNIDRKQQVIDHPFTPGLYLITITDLTSGRKSVYKQIIN